MRWNEGWKDGRKLTGEMEVDMSTTVHCLESATLNLFGSALHPPRTPLATQVGIILLCCYAS